jgi:hypothetical protein
MYELEMTTKDYKDQYMPASLTRVSDCCLATTQQFFSYIMVRTISNEMMMKSTLY